MYIKRFSIKYNIQDNERNLKLIAIISVISKTDLVNNSLMVHKSKYLLSCQLFMCNNKDWNIYAHYKKTLFYFCDHCHWEIKPRENELQAVTFNNMKIATQLSYRVRDRNNNKPNSSSSSPSLFSLYCLSFKNFPALKTVFQGGSVEFASSLDWPSTLKFL